MIKIEIISGTYFLRNKINDKFYVGHSINIYKRWNSHKSLLRKGTHHSQYLQRAWNKYGEDNFEFIIFMVCELEESIKWEQYFLDNYCDKLYNSSKNAKDGGDLISYNENKEEIINRRKETCKRSLDNLNDEERKLKYGLPKEKNGMYGKHHTEETKKIISEKLKGLTPPIKGKKYEEYMSEDKAKELKRGLSERAKLKTGENNPFFGKHHTEETKEKLKKANFGKKPVNMRKVKIEGNIYESITEASIQLNVCKATIIYRIKSKYFDYEYIM